MLCLGSSVGVKGRLARTNGSPKGTPKILVPAPRGSCRTVRTRCVHGSMFLEYSPSFYPVEQPPQNHTQGPCTLQPLPRNFYFLF